MKTDFDYFIVGQGIVGSMLAFRLKEMNRSVLLIDEFRPNSASQVAAGMWNPLSFKTLNATWNAKAFLNEVNALCPRIEEFIAQKIFHPCNILRIFPDNQSANLWDEKSDHSETSEFIAGSEVMDKIEQVNSPHGYGVVKGSGWLNVQLMLRSLREAWLTEDCLLEAKLDFDELEVGPDRIRLKSFSAARIIFCTGVSNAANPYFDFVDIIPNKGQLLTLQIKDFQLEHILNYGNFLIPVGGNEFKSGSTFELNATNDEITSEGRSLILEKFHSTVLADATVAQHMAGFRPTTYDRRPVAGAHPRYDNIFICNGFGSKAVMLAPLITSQFVQHLEFGAPMMPEISPSRFLH